MTAAARRVLGDCEAVLDLLEDEEDDRRWRVLWAGAMALLRAVGHVLHKVDGKDPVARSLIDAAWDRWNADKAANAIFWEFVEKERNNILKQYRFGVLDSAVVGLAVLEIDRETGHAVAVVESPAVLDENLFRPMDKGYRLGVDGRDVYQEALLWWDTELSRIEAGLGRSKP